MLKKKFLKKVSTLFLVGAIACSLMGCVRTEIGLDIHEDETADISMMAAMADAYSNGESFSEETFGEGTIKEFKEAGGTVTPYEEDGYKGIILKKTNVPLDDLNDKGFDFNKDMVESSDLTASDEERTDASDTSSKELFRITHDKKGVYTITYVYTGLSDFDTGSSSSYLGDMDMNSLISASGGYMKYKVTLPVEVIETNADTISEDKKTLEWNLLDKKYAEEPPYMSFKLKKTIPLWIIAIGIIAFISLIMIIVLLVCTIHKKRIELEEDTDVIDSEDNSDE